MGKDRGPQIMLIVGALCVFIVLFAGLTHPKATPQTTQAKVNGTITASESGGQIDVEAAGWPNGSTLVVLLEDGTQREFDTLMPTGSGSFKHTFTCAGDFKAYVVNQPGGIDESSVHPNCSPSTTGAAPSTTSIPPTTSPSTTSTTGSSVAPTTSASTPSTTVAPVASTTSPVTSPVSSVASSVTNPPNSGGDTSTPADGPPPTGLVLPPTK